MTKLLAATFVLLAASLCSNNQYALAQSTAQKTATGSARSEPVKVGEMAPDFTLEDFRVENEEWRKVRLSEARGRGPVVLVFYRGHW